jgi:hypothetical protein
VCERAVQKTTWKKGTPKKGNGQRNKLHVHLVKPETTICTQLTLDINALLVLLMSFYLWMFGQGESWEVVCLLRTKIARGGGGDSWEVVCLLRTKIARGGGV